MGGDQDPVLGRGKKLPYTFFKRLPFSNLPVPGRDLVRSQVSPGKVLAGKKRLLKTPRSTGEKGRGTVTFFPRKHMGNAKLLLEKRFVFFLFVN